MGKIYNNFILSVCY